MSLATVPKTVIDRSLKLARAPFDLALGAAGAEDSSAKRLLDRIEAGARSATGTVVGDDELRREGDDLRLATAERERASDLREQADLMQREAADEAEEKAAEAEERRLEARRKADAERRKAAR